MQNFNVMELEYNRFMYVGWRCGGAMGRNEPTPVLIEDQASLLAHGA